jgi:ActR/RegA family two-component response regulator
MSMLQQAKTQRSVLIVEDDPDFAESLVEMLQPRGYAPYHVDTAERAVAAMREPPGGESAPVALIDARLGAAAGVDLIPRCGSSVPTLSAC